jgi:hypothetical protein
MQSRNLYLLIAGSVSIVLVVGIVLLAVFLARNQQQQPPQESEIEEQPQKESEPAESEPAESTPTVQPIDCELNEWSEWSSCDKECDGGVQTRSRTIKTSPSSGGKECGETNEERQCNTQACPVPVDCATVNQFHTDWTDTIRNTVITALNKADPTTTTIASLQRLDNKALYDRLKVKCPDIVTKRRDCVWEWGPFGTCDKPCGGGKKQRTRVIKEAGRRCDGPAIDFADCNTGACPVPVDCAVVNQFHSDWTDTIRNTVISAINKADPKLTVKSLQGMDNKALYETLKLKCPDIVTKPVSYQAHDFVQFTRTGTDLPDQPINGTFSDCVKACQSDTSCVGFSRRKLASEASSSECWLKQSLPSPTFNNPTWRTFMKPNRDVPTKPTTSPTTSSTNQPTAPAPHQAIKTKDGKCWDIPNNEAKGGANIQIYDCNGSDAQKFEYSADGTIKHIPSELCVDIPGGNRTNGNKLILWDCNGGSNQKFTERYGSTFCSTRDRAADKCIDIPNNDTSNGSKLQIWDRNSISSAQQFTFTKK